jgi:UDP-3-O-[3-hydroxymyristoyl] glucosamine N-acyltransferase
MQYAGKVRAILGAGAHGQELAALYPDAVLCDDNPELSTYAVNVYAGADFVIGAAWPKTRRQIAARAVQEAASGVVVFPGAYVSPSAVLGRHSHVGPNATVSHGCRVGEFVNICPGVVLGGEVTVEDDVFIGAGAVVIHGGITIGKGAVIGAGAVVIRDVPAGETMVGNPAHRSHLYRSARAWAG